MAIGSWRQAPPPRKGRRKPPPPPPPPGHPILTGMDAKQQERFQENVDQIKTLADESISNRGPIDQVLIKSAMAVQMAERKKSGQSAQVK